MPNNYGNLSQWASQGVLLLNSILTVRLNQIGSHEHLGWQIFTDNIIKYISQHKTNVVFILWGNFAKQKNNLIDTKKHLTLMAPHPSPLSVYKGFFNCQHFIKANNFLLQNNLTPIQWQIIPPHLF